MVVRMKKARQTGTQQTSGFICMPARILAIIQLCLAFTVGICILCGPYVEEYLAIRGEILVYQTVMGERVPANTAHFQTLPSEERQEIATDYERLQQRADRPLLSKVWGAFREHASQLSPFKLAWVIASVVIPILLLKRREGALQMIWLLPAVALCYGMFAVQHSANQAHTNKIDLVPSEEWIVTKYLDAPLSGSISDQQKQLQLGWERYLAAEWSGESSTDAEETLFRSRVEKGEFAFNLARLRQLKKNHITSNSQAAVESPLAYGLYIVWNLFFAIAVTYYLRSNKSLAKEVHLH